jgi:hypothetical protein
MNGWMDGCDTMLLLVVRLLIGGLGRRGVTDRTGLDWTGPAAGPVQQPLQP